MFGTLRWRLTFWYGAVALVLLALFALVPLTFYASAAPIRQAQSEEVRLAARNAARLLGETDAPALVVESLREPNRWVVVRDAGGRTLASTPGLGEVPEMDVAPDSYPGVAEEGAYAATSVEVGDGAGTTVAIYQGLPIADDPFVRGLILAQGIGFLVALASMVGLGPTLATAALRPLRRVSEVAGELRRGRLESRVDLPGLKDREDEVGQVATSFDAMAESLEERFEAERESKESMRRFLADASHELRTPLTSLLGYLDVLGEGADRDPETRRRAHAAMGEEGRRMARTVEDLLTLARLESRQEMHAGPVDLATVARDVAGGFPEHRIAVTGAESVSLDADPDALRRVVSNLLSNAVRHTPPGRRIEVSVGLLGGEVVLRVADEGSGIPVKDLPHVLERFYRAEGSRASDGTGLGLAIVKETVEASGGLVEAESTPGKGSVFTIRIPQGGSDA